MKRSDHNEAETKRQKFLFEDLGHVTYEFGNNQYPKLSWHEKWPIIHYTVPETYKNGSDVG